jgi:hypothetical protein
MLYLLWKDVLPGGWRLSRCGIAKVGKQGVRIGPDFKLEHTPSPASAASMMPPSWMRGSMSSSDWPFMNWMIRPLLNPPTTAAGDSGSIVPTTKVKAG